ncbi:hypothetical protein H9W90_09795 [Polaribacter pectinis]|uniref:Uncharacterized protein n=1 Tax=Polaribacter pectinis TaxID=2738844 RepID=A0A7G9L789_9FLAO|nr:hypothetical protein [Polaribacter pectinis]QNM84488.1 hypothetical protein H9W90_09795 [Polaribacter pectinis]
MLLLKFISKKIENTKEKLDYYRQIRRANSRHSRKHYLERSRKRYKSSTT